MIDSGTKSVQCSLYVHEVGEFDDQDCCRGGRRTCVAGAVHGHDRDLGSVPGLVLGPRFGFAAARDPRGGSRGFQRLFHSSRTELRRFLRTASSTGADPPLRCADGKQSLGPSRGLAGSFPVHARGAPRVWTGQGADDAGECSDRSATGTTTATQRASATATCMYGDMHVRRRACTATCTYGDMDVAGKFEMGG